MIGLHLREKTWLWLVLAGWVYIGLVAVPLSWYIDVRSIDVFSAPTPEQVIMKVDRSVRRNFAGYYQVTVRRNPSGVFVCSTGRSVLIHYLTTRELPQPLHLWWWMGSKQSVLDCEDNEFTNGGYYLETCWTVEKPFWGIVPDKTDCVDSAGFRIEGGKP